MDLEFILEAAGQGLLVVWTRVVEDREESTSVPELSAGMTGWMLVLPREMQEARSASWIWQLMAAAESW